MTRDERQQADLEAAALARWLAAEDDDDAGAAEAALGTLFAALPALDPPPGLADRVLRETVWSVGPAPAVGASHRLWRPAALAAAVLAGALVVAGGVAAALSPALGWFSPGSALAGSVGAMVVLLRNLGRWLGPVAEVLLGFASVAGDLGGAAVTTPVVGVLGLALAGAAASLKVLHDMVERDRRVYVRAT